MLSLALNANVDNLTYTAKYDNINTTLKHELSCY